MIDKAYLDNFKTTLLHALRRYGESKREMSVPLQRLAQLELRNKVWEVRAMKQDIPDTHAVRVAHAYHYGALITVSERLCACCISTSELDAIANTFNDFEEQLLSSLAH